MCNIRHLLLVALLIIAGAATAATITESQAREIAARFMADKAIPTTSLKMAHKAPRMGASQATGNAAYYVFNADHAHGGYVIVAGDDRAPAVLGYSDNGTFDSKNMPEAMQELLDSYADQIEALNHGGKAAPHLITGTAIAPLITASWSQNSPYNILFPYLPNRNHAYVGCVATAMAQVMYYWKHPERTSSAIPGYTSQDLSIYMPALPSTTFNWNAMQDTYLTSDSLSSGGQAVAKLSLYCAQTLEMNFNVTGSAAYSHHIVRALKNYFGYKSTANYYERKFFTTDEWESIVYEELAAKRPIVYSGSKQTGGHAFVCDGYDGNGLFHINWGWNGSSNGYFLLNVLNPYAQGTGGAEGAYGYIQDQSIVVGIEPGTSSAPDVQVTARQLNVETYSSTRPAASMDFNARIFTQFYNLMDETISFDYGWALYKDDAIVKTFYCDYHSGLAPRYYRSNEKTLSFGSGMANGSYRLVAVYCKPNTYNWKPCLGSDVNYAIVNINGNNCRITTYGMSKTPDYTVNSIKVTGHKHPNRPIFVDVNLTNNGFTRNDLIYMFVNSIPVSEGYIDIESEDEGTVHFEYMPIRKGTYTMTFSLNSDGSDPIASRNITINEMPMAKLNATATPLNVTDVSNRIITSDKYSVLLKVTNVFNDEYNEDITIKLYKQTQGNYGSAVQTLTQSVQLGINESKVIRFDFDNVVNGWSYFTKAFYYSSGSELSLAGTTFYTIVFPNGPGGYRRGDVNGDGEVNIADVDVVISIILGKSVSTEVKQRADVNQDNEINISDVDAIIQIVLGN